jgi:hypothetical protein
MHLKQKLPFPLDYNEFGFAKLKDFIGSMSDQVKLELRGNNHPFACLNRKQAGRYSEQIPGSANLKKIRPFLSDDVKNEHR